MKTHFSIIGILFCLYGCNPRVEEINVPLDNIYSVSSFISPQDSIFTAYVFKVNKIGDITGADTSLVKNAKVFISDNLTADTLIYNYKSFRYEAKRIFLNIEEGKKYKIGVKINGILITGECQIPQALTNGEIAIQSNLRDSNFTLTWDNPSGNLFFYFNILCRGDYLYNNIKFQLSANLDNDIILPSNQHFLRNEFTGIVKETIGADSAFIVATIANVDYNFYKFFETYRAYKSWNFNNGGIVPNFQQPVPIFTNIKNGVGVFAGVNKHIVSTRIK